MNASRLLVPALAAALFLFALPVQADTVTYTFELTIPNGLPVTDVVLYAAGDGVDDFFLAPGVLSPTGIQTLSHTVGFVPTRALIVGLNPAPPPGSPHVVLFTNDAFAASAYGVKWSSVFDSSSPDYIRHSSVITRVLDAHAGDPGGLLDFLRGPQTFAAFFDPTGPFSVVVFSGGDNGGSSLPKPVPEPSMLALLAATVAGFALLRRRR